MIVIVCPNCNKINSLIELGDGIYKCNNCGYLGSQFGKGVFKK